MGDCWSCNVVLWPFPVSLDEGAGEELLDHLAGAGVDLDVLTDVLRGEGDCVVIDADGNRSLLVDDGEYQLRFDEQKGAVLHICEYQASGGTAQFTETSLPASLREQEIAYVITDDGDYGNHGEEYSWHPGMAKQRVRQRLSSGDGALGDSGFESFKARAATKHGIDIVKLGELVLEHFEYDPYDWWPGQEAPEEVELPVVEVKPGQRSRPSGLAG